MIPSKVARLNKQANELCQTKWKKVYIEYIFICIFNIYMCILYFTDQLIYREGVKYVGNVKRKELYRILKKKFNHMFSIFYFKQIRKVIDDLLYLYCYL